MTDEQTVSCWPGVCSCCFNKHPWCKSTWGSLSVHCHPVIREKMSPKNTKQASDDGEKCLSPCPTARGDIFKWLVLSCQQSSHKIIQFTVIPNREKKRILTFPKLLAAKKKNQRINYQICCQINCLMNGQIVSGTHLL